MTAVLLVISVGLLAMVIDLTIRVVRLTYLLRERTRIIHNILGGTHEVITEEVAAAGEALGAAARRLDLSGLGERVGQEERRA